MSARHRPDGASLRTLQLPYRYGRAPGDRLRVQRPDDPAGEPTRGPGARAITRISRPPAQGQITRTPLRLYTMYFYAWYFEPWRMVIHIDKDLVAASATPLVLSIL